MALAAIVYNGVRFRADWLSAQPAQRMSWGAAQPQEHIAQDEADSARTQPPWKWDIYAREEGVGRIVQRSDSLIVYEALLTQRESLGRVQAMRRDIEQRGGALSIEQAGNAILVTLTLPAQYVPEQFYPNMPFYPV